MRDGEIEVGRRATVARRADGGGGQRSEKNDGGERTAKEGPPLQKHRQGKEYTCEYFSITEYKQRNEKVGTRSEAPRPKESSRASKHTRKETRNSRHRIRALDECLTTSFGLW